MTGIVDMVTNPIETLESIGYMIANPIDTEKYMANAVKDSFVRDVINGDAESRAHWFTYAAGTIAGTKGVSSGIKSTRMGSNALRNAKDIANKAGDIKVPNLSPFNPQHQLAPVGPVPYNVYDGYNLRDQLWMKAEKFSAGGKSNRDVGGTGNVSPDVIRKVENNILDKMESVGGHTLERHVGKTNEDLIKRAIQENVEAATSFTDKSIATKAIQENLRKNADAIEEWLNKSDTGRMVFDVSHKNPIGKGALEDKKQVIYDLTNSRVVLIRDTTNELGFSILTGFPVVK